MNVAPIDWIRSLPRADRLAFYRSLPPGALAAARHDPRFFARPAQRALLDAAYADKLAPIETIGGGRRAGKTLVATWVMQIALLSGRLRDLFPRIVAATDDDARDTVLLGRSGLLTWMPPEHMPAEARRGRTLPKKLQSLYFPTVDTEVHILTAEKPSQAIGQGSGFTLADDPAKWIDQSGRVRATEMLKQIRISNSEGRAPAIVIPSTPRSDFFLRQVLTPGQLRGSRHTYLGDTNDNTALSADFKAGLSDLRTEDPSEFDGILREDTPGALWRRRWIARVEQAPDLARVVVAVDPADDAKDHSDETGIVVVGLGHDGRLYVLADLTGRTSTDLWPAVVAWAFRAFSADAIVAETNRAAGLVRRLLAIEAPGLPLVEVAAARGKETRAEPLSLLYRDGHVSHVATGPQLSQPGTQHLRVPVFDPETTARVDRDVEVKRDRRRYLTLEDELCGWVPGQGRSPNGLDALVWAAWHLRPPDGGSALWTPAAGSPALAGRYADVDPRRGSPGGAYQLRRPGRR